MSLKEKQEWLPTFSKCLAKTPLHSRRWFSVHNVKDIEKDSDGNNDGSESQGNNDSSRSTDKDSGDLSLVKALLNVEWESIALWGHPRTRTRPRCSDWRSSCISVARVLFLCRVLVAALRSIQPGSEHSFKQLKN